MKLHSSKDVMLFGLLCVLYILEPGINCPMPAFCKQQSISSVTISGTAKENFEVVALFEDGKSVKPIRYVHIDPTARQYSITIAIPGDMRTNGNIYFIDMRFWKDVNGNGIREHGEPLSQCHFIIWDPKTNEVYMQVYKGSKYPMSSNSLKYDLR